MASGGTRQHDVGSYRGNVREIAAGVAGSRWPLLAAAAGAVVVVAGCTISGGSSAPPAGSHAQADGSYALPAGVHTLTIDNPVGDVRVSAAAGSSRIRVVQQPGGKATGYRKVSGPAATVGSRCPGGIRFGLHGCHMDYQIQMPPGAAITVVGLAGDITLQGRLAKAQVNTHAGTVRGTGLGRGSFTVATEAGNVSLAFASPPALAKATTSLGNISVTVPGSASYKVSTSTTLGSKDVKVPDEAQAANVIDLHTEAGDVSLQQQ